VTTPLPAVLTFPDFYAGGYPDIEILLQSLFQPLVGTQQNTDGSWTPCYVVTFLPDPDIYNAWLDQGFGYLRVYRMGGKINYDQNRDEPRVAIAGLTRRRDDSWYLIEFVRQMLNAFQRGGTVPGTPYELTMAGEVVGPQQIPEIIQDDRLVQLTFELHVKKPKALPNYRVALGL
jgi:hypothetical protein